MISKDQAHRLIDELPEGMIGEVADFISFLNYREKQKNPVLQALRNAPLDDEPTTEEDRHAIQEGKSAKAKGELVSHEDVCREFGL